MKFKQKHKNLITNSVIGACAVLTTFNLFSINFAAKPSTPQSTTEKSSTLEDIINRLTDSNTTDKPIITAEEPPSQITLVRTKSGTTETVDTETYIKGVVAAEMPNTFELEALKAQAVAIRGLTFSRTINPSKHKGFKDADLCDDFRCCQAYDPSKINDSVIKAVDDTKGIAPVLAGSFAETLYFASTLEGTITNEQVWGNENKFTSIYKELEGPSPESKILPDVKNKYPYTSSSTSIEIDSFIKTANKLYPSAKLTKDNFKDNLKVVSRTKGGYVEKFQLGNITISGSDVRYKLIKELKSSNFSMSISDSTITFTTKGYGHGAGMSQWGANALAKEGESFKDILNYYYQNIDLAKVY